MVDNTADGIPPLVVAPRHLRRRAVHEEIPDVLLVPDVPPFTPEPKPAGTAKRQATPANPKGSALQRKRRVALIGVIIVSLAIPALLSALLLAG